MKLLTKEIEEKFLNHPFGSQEGKGSYSEILVKYFNPIGAGTWLITEAEKQKDGDYLMFGYCHIHEWEWGYVSLKELQELELPFGMGIERDLYINDKEYVKDEVNYPYKENIALKSGYYFLPIDKKDIDFFDKLKQTENRVEFQSEILEVYDAFDPETSHLVDEYFGDRMGFNIDDYKVKAGDYEY